MLKKVLTDRKDNPEKEDRLRVMLALSDENPSVAGPCPDPNDMAAFVEGTLKRKKNKEIMAHLNVCHDCYNDWLMVSEAIAEPKKASLKKSSLVDDLKMFFEDAMSWFSIPKPVYAYGFATAVAACLIITFWAATGNNLDDLIRNSYPTKVVAGITQDDLEFNNIYKLPWEKSKTSFGFAPLPIDSDTSRAFGAGLYSARQEVVGDIGFPSNPDFAEEKHGWQKSPRDVDFWLGRWSYLLRAVCLADDEIPQDFWQSQLNILGKIQKKYTESHRENSELLKAVKSRLDNIRSVLSISDLGSLNRENRRDIAVELDYLINVLSPRDSNKG